jgi:hypothetical protein
MITAAFWCRDCGLYHRLPVIVHMGALPPAVIIGSGPGAGYQYNLTAEDLGQTDGLSVPVYRPVAEFVLPDFPPMAARKKIPSV